VKGKWLLACGTVVLLATAAGVVSVLRQGRKTMPGAAGSVASAFSGPVLSLTGRIEPVEVVAVPVPFAGKIISMPVSVGAEVAEGELLAEISSPDLASRKEGTDAELNRLRNRVSTLESTLAGARLDASRSREATGIARAAMDESQKALLRQQTLFSKGAAARQSVEKVQAAYDGAVKIHEAQLKVLAIAEERVAQIGKDLDEQQQTLIEKTKESESADEELGSGDVKSPVDGYVVARKGQVGEDVTLEVQDLFQIAVNLSTLKVVVDAPPPALAKVRPGQEAILQIAEAPEAVPAKVTEVRDGQIFIEFARPNAEVKPGLTVQVVIKLT
jgi:multidrug resistance efflux pump